MFVDNARVQLSAGRGGDGRVSFRTEKYVDHGGPDGGDGGRGGNIIFVADNNTSTLVDFRIRREITAPGGEPGGERKKHGRSGADRIIRVPVGTQIFRGDDMLVDLITPGQQAVIAKGGDGGFGNAHFKSSVRQTPRVAELGEQGDSFEARLELKLIADVGLVGFPNAGKSTFLSVVSNARPEIADYAFTTLTPNLGVADVDDLSLLIADIPGLIEGASEGKGLGDAFLRHIERTAVILHIIDAYTNDPAAAYNTIRTELVAYSPLLADLPEVVVLNKTDGLDADIVADQLAQLNAVVDHDRVLTMSAIAHVGLNPVLRTLVTVVKQVRADQAAAAAAAEVVVDENTISLSTRQLEDGWNVRMEEGAYVVTGAKIEKFAARTDYGNVHSVNRLRDIIKKMGVSHQLLRQGAEPDDIVIFGEAGDYRMSFEEKL